MYGLDDVEISVDVTGGLADRLSKVWTCVEGCVNSGWCWLDIFC